jgi:hypothetical protein
MLFFFFTYHPMRLAYLLLVSLSTRVEYGRDSKREGEM